MTGLAAKNIKESADDVEKRLFWNLCELRRTTFEEARKAAGHDLALLVMENSADVYAGLKEKLGNKEAATLVMCMLQDAVGDGSIVATRYKFPEGENEEEISVATDPIDEWCLGIRYTDAKSVFLTVSEFQCETDTEKS